MIELLDQIVREVPAGTMRPFIKEVQRGSNEELKRYIDTRRENTAWVASDDSFSGLLKKVRKQRFSTLVTYGYIKAVSMLLPRNLRLLVFNNARIGERHKWMYDSYGLSKLFRKAGFVEVNTCAFNTSKIPNFNEFCLDCNNDGAPYKNRSLYIEGVK